ncbi:M15 family metallopeptidase [Actinokineospora auranticolor]|uniref:D-alanyl-D-alanine carboxypeptidase-like protein n=1 Tax=Actinokineospora auranticolor TaxID=155976 RepID=A0A2S6GCZ6_9PSEU|nr:M15 family metallopeptidase [Actinokineospora auranticolor]PPK62546.1 D-alanyl-D-alanine carboxypeptidase-like protein [Actinokineospora auranticolor]
MRKPATALLTSAFLLATAAPAAATAPYLAFIFPVSKERLGASWRPGCPVPPENLRLVTLTTRGFDGRTHRGELIVAKDVAVEVVRIFGDLYRHRYPVERMETVEKYDADDDRSMAANNTSAFNCRPITGGTEWSNHSYGRAIDINPVRNPYISGSGTVYPPNGAPYVDRTRTDPGLIHADDHTVRAFEGRDWDWGGYWTSPIDYQHFEKP